MTHRIAAALAVLLHRLRAESDRGDSPVPTSIIIAGLAILAVAVVAWAVARANGFMATAPGAGAP